MKIFCNQKQKDILVDAISDSCNINVCQCLCGIDASKSEDEQWCSREKCSNCVLIRIEWFVNDSFKTIEVEGTEEQCMKLSELISDEMDWADCHDLTCTANEGEDGCIDIPCPQCVKNRIKWRVVKEKTEERNSEPKNSKEKMQKISSYLHECSETTCAFCSHSTNCGGVDALMKSAAEEIDKAFGIKKDPEPLTFDEIISDYEKFGGKLIKYVSNDNQEYFGGCGYGRLLSAYKEYNSVNPDGLCYLDLIVTEVNNDIQHYGISRSSSRIFMGISGTRIVRGFNSYKFYLVDEEKGTDN